MLLTMISVLLGFSVGKGKHRSYRRWKILGIVLGMAFFLSIIFGVLQSDQGMDQDMGTLTYQIASMIQPMGMTLFYYFPYIPNQILAIILYSIFSMSLTFFWFLVGMFIKWMASKRGL